MIPLPTGVLGVDRGWPYRHAAWDAELGSPSAGGAQA